MTLQDTASETGSALFKVMPSNCCGMTNQVGVSVACLPRSRSHLHMTSDLLDSYIHYPPLGCFLLLGWPYQDPMHKAPLPATILHKPPTYILILRLTLPINFQIRPYISLHHQRGESQHGVCGGTPARSTAHSGKYLDVPGWKTY